MESAPKQAFEESFVQVFQEMGLSGLSVAPIETGREGFDYVCMIGIAGKIQGYLLLCLSMSNLIALSRRLTSCIGGSIESHDPGIGLSAVAELANLLGGRSTMLLGNLGLDCSITPPTSVRGRGVEAVIAGLEEDISWSVSGDGLSFVVRVLSKKTPNASKTC